MELPRLATVCLVVATALAETVNFWASMANGCAEECGATRARDAVLRRAIARPIASDRRIGDAFRPMCARASGEKIPPTESDVGFALNAHTRVGIAECPNDASRPRARMRRMRRARQSARDDGRARFRDESARASNNALRGSRAEAGRARAGRVERRARDADGFRFVRLRFVAIAFGRRIARARGRIAIERGTRAR